MGRSQIASHQVALIVRLRTLGLALGLLTVFDQEGVMYKVVFRKLMLTAIFKLCQIK